MKNLLAQEMRLPMDYVGCAHCERGSDLCVQSLFVCQCMSISFYHQCLQFSLRYAVLMLECVLTLNASLHGWPQA